MPPNLNAVRRFALYKIIRLDMRIFLYHSLIMFDEQEIITLIERVKDRNGWSDLKFEKELAYPGFLRTLRTGAKGVGHRVLARTIQRCEAQLQG
jgi:hypothetical protein